MDGRISRWFLTLPLTFLCGCITTQTTSVAPPNGLPEGTKVTKKDDQPKRSPQASTMIGLGTLKEADADADNVKDNPEMQAKLRDEARQAYQFALKIDPNSVEAARRLGKLYARTGDFARAFDILKKTADKNPKDAEVWYDLGMCHARHRDFVESIRCLSKAIEIDPQHRDCLKMLGLSLAWTGKVEQGLVYLTQAQGAALAHYNIACMFDQKAQPELAKEHCRLARRENGELLAEARELLTALETPAGFGALGGPQTRQ
jgi:tetratricopeptide (TPR) repeat protein